jgi:RNA polymerase sigma factor (sigma-70 family)
MGSLRHQDASDAELISLTAEDPDAFGVFYDRFEASVLAFTYRATHRPDIAADLTAETFAAALQSAASFRPELGSARAWLFGIARHQLADAWQRGQVEDRARRRLELEPLTLSDATLEEIEQLADTDDPSTLRLLDELPEAQRAAIHGRVIQEREYHELAADLSCSESVARQRVSRGLRSLRSRLEQTK